MTGFTDLKTGDAGDRSQATPVKTRVALGAMAVLPWLGLAGCAGEQQASSPTLAGASQSADAQSAPTFYEVENTCGGALLLLMANDQTPDEPQDRTAELEFIFDDRLVRAVMEPAGTEAFDGPPFISGQTLLVAVAMSDYQRSTLLGWETYVLGVADLTSANTTLTTVDGRDAVAVELTGESCPRPLEESPSPSPS